MGVLSNTKGSEKSQTTVPKPARNLLDVGDRVEWHVENGDVIGPEGRRR